ncbi:hypothetical protein HRbin33_00584 [bacterium HR33]|nr:hypothetical protein HRbin33_00584 [bacterium HR33]
MSFPKNATVANRCRVSGCIAILAAGLAAGCDLSGILDVDLPGRVAEEALEDPDLAKVLVNGVIADAECAWNTYSAAASHHSDEWIPASGNLNMRNWGQRKIRADDFNLGQGTCDNNYGVYLPLHTARFQAKDVFERLNRFDPAKVPDKVKLQATVRAYGAFAILAIGEGFCEATIDGGPLMTPAQVLAEAEKWFTEAIDLASQAGDADILNMARVGRARVRVDLKKWSEVIPDASAVPPGYVKNATRDTNRQRRWNYLFEYLVSTAGGFNRHGSVANHFRNLTVDANGEHTQGSGTPDPRVRVFTNNQLAFDFSTIHWTTDKYKSRSDPLPMATYKEAQLYLAEAYAQLGQLSNAVAIINALHAAAGLPPWAAGATATKEQVIAHVIDERARELFVEGGHRLNDMLRYRGTQFNIPFLGEPGSIHPNGVDQTGDTYGDTTCFPLPAVERSGNPNVP